MNLVHVFPSSSLRVAHVASISVWVFVRVEEGMKLVGFFYRSEDWGEKKKPRGSEEGKGKFFLLLSPTPPPLWFFALHDLRAARKRHCRKKIDAVFFFM